MKLRLIDSKMEAKREARRARQRAYHTRKKSGEAVVGFKIDLVEASERLIEAGWLDYRDAENRRAIRAALEAHGIIVIPPKSGALDQLIVLSPSDA